MKKLAITILSLSFVTGFLCFQNCQKAPQANDVTANNSTDVTGSTNQANTKSVDLAQERLSEISFIFSEVETIKRTSGSYQLSVTKNLKINLSSGAMILTSDSDNSQINYCLSEDLRNELVNLLKNSKVCHAEPASGDRLCTQVMKMPYAILNSESQSYNLGSATDGCGSNGIDLCDSESQKLISGYIANLKSKYKMMSCPK